MRGLRARILIAIDASGVSGAVVAGALGAPRVKAFARSPLTPGALRPGPVEANVVRADEVAQAIAKVAAGLESARSPIALILPDGVARIVLLEVASGVPPCEFARYRITPGLPYAPEEAVV